MPHHGILIVTPSISRTGGGVSEVVRLSVKGLARTPMRQLDVFTLDDAYFDEDIANWDRTMVRRFRAYGPRNFGFSPRLAIAIWRSRPRLIHVHGVWMFHCAAVLIWSLLTGGKYVVTPHGMLEAWIRKRSPVLKALVSYLYHDQFLKRASCFQALTPKEVEDIHESVGERPVRLIPNYVEIDQARNVPERSPNWWRPAFENKDVFLYFGRIHEKKGCLELCEAWSDLCSDNSDFQSRSVLIFCGWIDGLATFEDRLNELHARFGNVLFAGPQYGDDKSSSIEAASFVVLPSKSEGLPITILEAWAKSKPVAITPECNIPQAFACRAAVEIAPDAQSILGGLLACFNMPPTERLATGAAGRDLLHTYFSETSVVGCLTAMYRDITENRETTDHVTRSADDVERRA